MNNHAKLYHRAAILLLCFCMGLVGNADVFAICLSDAHPGGAAIHYVAHKASSAGQEGTGPSCNSDQFSNENHCVDIELTNLGKTLRPPCQCQTITVIDPGAFLDSKEMARFFHQRPATDSSLPAFSPPIFLQTQAFLN
ncbi:MAG TPA: hypothetical protein VKN73_06065 [Desulfosalsimonadaceae bacterium]|nr:hypothetical protein [Desulfosalsimonadaceae bacterium]